jgi:DNA primase
MKYLRDRGLSDELIKKFSIGWCPKNTKFKDKTRDLDSLKGRVIFPIKDEYGDIISFSGRIPRKDTGDDDKWWHESYTKSFFLYGFDAALLDIMKKDFVIIVEGQMDVVQCHKHGLTNTIGLMGTNLTIQHIAKIVRFTSNFIFMLDGDKPGREATTNIRKFFDRAINNGYDFKYIDVPLIVDGKSYDPDEFLKTFGVIPIKKKIRSQAEKLKRG